MQLMTPCQYGVALYLDKHDVQIENLRIFWQRTLLSLASPKHGWAERRGTRIVLTATGRQILESTKERFQHPRERK